MTQHRYNKARAVILSALVLVSMIGGTVAFAGTAAAASSNLTVDSPTQPVQPGTLVTISADSSGNNITFAIDENNNGTIQSGEVIETVTPTDGTSETTFTPSNYGVVTDADEPFSIYAVEEDNSDGQEDTIPSTSDTNATLTVDGDAPQNPDSITVQTPTPINSETSVDVDVNFTNAPESGTVSLRITDGSNTETTTKTASQTTSFTGLDLSGLDAGQLTATAKITDDAGNENPAGYTASTTFRKRTASVSAQPNGAQQTSTHTATVAPDSQIDVSVFEVDYSDGAPNFDGDITDATVESFGLDTTGDDSIDTSLTADQVSYADGSVLTVENTSGVTIDAGEQLILTYSGVTNPSADTDVGLNLDPSTSDVAVTRTLSIGGTSAPTVEDVSINGTSVTDSGVYDEAVNGTSLDFKVEFNKSLDTNTEPSVSFTIGGEAVEITNTNFEDGSGTDEDGSGTDDVYNGSVDVNVDNAEASATVDVSGAVGTDGNTQTSTNSRTFEIDTASLGVVSAETAENDADDADNVVVTLNDTYSDATRGDFSVTDDDNSNVPIDSVVTATGDNTQLELTFTSENSLAANATPNVTLETGSGIQDDAGNTVASSEKIEAADVVAPDIPTFTHSVSGDQVTLTVGADEPLNTGAITVELTNGATTTVTGFQATDSQNTYEATTTVADADWTATLTQAEDEAGNDVADGKTTSPSVDTSGPSFTLVTPGDDPTTNNSNIDIAIDDQTGVNTDSTYITVEDADGVVLDNARAAPTGSNIEITQNASLGDGSDDLTIDNLDLADGQVNIIVESEDTNGYSNSAEFTYEVDTQVNSGKVVTPSETVYKPMDGTLQVKYNYVDSNVDVVDIKLVDDNGEDTVTYNINDGDYVDDGTNKTVTLDLANTDTNASAGDTDYRVDVIVNDSLNNEDTYSTTGEFVVIDDTEPATSDFNTEDGTNSQTNFSFDIDEVDGTDSGVDAGTIDLEVNQSGNTLFEGTTADSAVSFDSGTLTFDTAEAGISYDDATPVNINVSVSDNVGNTLDTSTTEGPGFSFTVNDVDPVVDSVETEAGTNTVEVEFNEGVYANNNGTGAVDATDFAYQSDNGGATAIDSVAHEAGDSAAVLTLDADVTASDVGSDLISVNENQVYDGNGIAVDHTTTTALDDTTDPAVPGLTAGNVTAGNEENYVVTVTAPNASTADVAVKNSSSGDTFAQQSEDVSSGIAEFTFELTDLEQGDVTIAANVTDLGVDRTSADATEMVTKDSESATIDVTGNAGQSHLEVTFSEPVTGADNANNYGLQNLSVNDVHDVDDDQVYVLELTDTLDASDINSNSVTVNATGIADVTGTAASDANVQISDDTEPYFTRATAESGDSTVELEFSEMVYNDTDTNLTAENVQFQNSADGVDHEIVGIEHTAGAMTATVTLNSSLVEADLGSDEIQVANFNDSVDNNNTQTLSITDEVQVTDVQLKNTSDYEVQIYFNATDKLQNFTADLDSQNTLVETADDQHVDETFYIEDANVVENGDEYTYTVDYTVPRDGEYDLDLTNLEALDGESSATGFVDDKVEVDYTDPEPVDAEHTGLSKSGNSLVAVQFDEPVQKTENFDVSNIMVGGNEADSVPFTGANENEILVEFDTVLATGDAPNIEFGVDTIEETYGDTAAADTSETVDTLEVSISEGTNFVSVPAEFGSLDISESGFSEMDVMAYMDGEWKSYGSGAIETMEGGQGYIVTADADQAGLVDVTVRNEEPGSSAEDATPGQQQLAEGWNLVGHWQEGSQDAADGAGNALNSIGGSSTATNIYTQDVSGEFSYATTDTFNPGEAYWVFLEDDEVYTASNYDYGDK